MTLRSSLTIVPPRGSLCVLRVTCPLYPTPLTSSEVPHNYPLILGSRGPRNPWSPGTQGMTRRQSGSRGYLEFFILNSQ